MSEQMNPRRRNPRKPEPKRPAQEVVYTQPRPFRSKRLIVHLATLVALVLAVFLGMSVFFKVDTVLIAGANKYSAITVEEASGLKKGDSLLFFGKNSTANRIMKNLPYVSKVLRFDVKLPGTVTIWIEEIPVVYAIQETGGNWWLMSADGKLTEQVDAAAASKCTQITGVRLKDPKAGEQAVADNSADQSEIIMASDHLAAALKILEQIELNQLMGKIVSVDVSDLLGLEMWYGTRFQIKLGDSQRLDYKIAATSSVIGQLSSNRTGVLDASFTTYPDEINCTPFGK